MPNYKENLDPLKHFYDNLNEEIFQPMNVAGQLQRKSYLPTNRFVLLLTIALVATLLMPNFILTKLYLIALVILQFVMIWQPLHYFEPKEQKEKIQLYYYIQNYPVYRFRNHFLFIKDFSARPYAYVYTTKLKKVTRLSSKVQYDKLFKRDIKALKNNEEVEINGFLDTAFNELKEKKLPIIKF